MKLSKSDGSMSVLVPGQEDLRRRICLGTHKQDMVIWFAAVEIKAWEWVNAVYGDSRPDKIFLVTGQTLTTEYAISHHESQPVCCEIVVEGSGGLPTSFDANRRLGYYDLRRVSATAGFDLVRRRQQGNDSPTQWTVFLEVFESKPLKRIRSSSLFTRILEAHR